MHGTLIHIHSSRHNWISNCLDFRGEALREVPVCDASEYEIHGRVVELVYGDGIEVTEETRGDGVTPTSRGTHSCYQYDIHQVDLRDKDKYLPQSYYHNQSIQILVFTFVFSFRSYQFQWSSHCLSSSMGGWAPYSSLAGMFRSSTNTTYYPIATLINIGFILRIPLVYY